MCVPITCIKRIISYLVLHPPDGSRVFFLAPARSCRALAFRMSKGSTVHRWAKTLNPFRWCQMRFEGVFFFFGFVAELCLDHWGPANPTLNEIRWFQSMCPMAKKPRAAAEHKPWNPPGLLVSRIMKHSSMPRWIKQTNLNLRHINQRTMAIPHLLIHYSIESQNFNHSMSSLNNFTTVYLTHPHKIFKKNLPPKACQDPALGKAAPWRRTLVDARMRGRDPLP